MQIKNGSLLLFRLFGVNVFVHWSWALIVAARIWWRTHPSSDSSIDKLVPHSLGYFTALYLCLFLIVLIHEFGHALACKSVGGHADRIVLWPLGGIAFVDPPPRPGAYLWSIVAGPLVNIILLPLTIIPAILIGGFYEGATPLASFIGQLAEVNAVLLIFNMLPIYPLDGGQIFRALAWFAFGRGTSLVIAAVVGIVGAVGIIILALFTQNFFLAVVVAFLVSQSFPAIKIGLAMRRIDNAPRHAHARCPHCGEPPPQGNLWRCPCGNTFDTFAANAQCPRCNQQFPITACPMCGKASPMPLWHPPGFPVTIPPMPAPPPPVTIFP